MLTPISAHVSPYRAAVVCGLLLSLATAATTQGAAPVTVASPDGKIKVEIQADSAGQLTWAVQRQGKGVLAPAPVGLTVDGKDLGKAVTLGTPRTSTIDEKYPTFGNHSVAVNRCNEAVIPVESGGIKYELDVRAFDDGAAVRSRIPLDDTAHTITGEATSWAIPANAAVWYARYDGSYESPCLSGTSDALPSGTNLAPPMTFKVGDNLYVSLTEANNDCFPDMGLRRDEDFLKAVFPASARGWSA